MKHVILLFLLILLSGCPQKKVAEVPGQINFKVTEFEEARMEARDSGRLLLAYFYTDW